MNTINKIIVSPFCYLRYFLILVIFAITFAGNVALAFPVIDANQPIIDENAGITYACGGNSEQMLAQTVTTGITGLLTEVRLPVAGAYGDLIVEIQGVSEGEPDGQILTSETFAATSLPPFDSSPTFRSLAFTIPVALQQGDLYSIVLKSSGSFGLWPGPVGDPYPGGSAFYDSRPNQVGVWVPMSPRTDLAFQTVIDTDAAAASDFIIMRAMLEFKKSADTDKYKIKGSFTLGENSDGINPLEEVVKIKFGTSHLEIPAGSFYEKDKENYVFVGKIVDVHIGIRLKKISSNSFRFWVWVTGIDLTDTPNPVPIEIHIGNDIGQTEIWLTGILKLK